MSVKKLTETKLKKIIALYKKGFSKEEISHVFGVSRSTVNVWMRNESKNNPSLLKLLTKRGPKSTFGWAFSDHPSECPIKTCNEELIDNVKSGFKKGKKQQWKAYCHDHGYIYYDITNKEDNYEPVNNT